jgi:peptidyl-tRNA hydrolase, PTH1 family
MMFTIVPLGNPGKEYELTRHNAARIVLGNIQHEFAQIAGCEVFVPDTFMNESGRAIAEYLRYHEGRELIIMHDDKDIPLGKIRVSFDRGDGGHNGVKNIIEQLGKTDFIRIRIGIAPVSEDGVVGQVHGEEVQKFVLARFKEEEQTELRALSAKVLSAIKTIVEEGYAKAMERCN